MRRHPYSLCVDIPQTFARPPALNLHMLTHTKENVSCAAFESLFLVRKQTHSFSEAETCCGYLNCFRLPHTYSVCLRAFTISSNLKRHAKLHA